MKSITSTADLKGTERSNKDFERYCNTLFQTICIFQWKDHYFLAKIIANRLIGFIQYKTLQNAIIQFLVPRFPTCTVCFKLSSTIIYPKCISSQWGAKKGKSKMASPFGDGVRVLLTCSCSALSPPSRLYFCRHCIKLRCPLCVSHEVNLSQKPTVMVTI